MGAPSGGQEPHLEELVPRWFQCVASIGRHAVFRVAGLGLTGGAWPPSM